MIIGRIKINNVVVKQVSNTFIQGKQARDVLKNWLKIEKSNFGQYYKQAHFSGTTGVIKKLPICESYAVSFTYM